jgi:hypothetical protein
MSSTPNANDKEKEVRIDIQGGFNGAVMDVDDNTSERIVTFEPTTTSDEQLHPFLIRIDVDHVRQWKVYRDAEGLYAVHNKIWEHYPTEHIINLK